MKNKSLLKQNFQLLKDQKRVKIVYFDQSMNSRYLSVLKWQNELLHREFKDVIHIRTVVP